jgi:hypothetical protein
MAGKICHSSHASQVLHIGALDFLAPLPNLIIKVRERSVVQPPVDRTRLDVVGNLRFVLCLVKAHKAKCAFHGWRRICACEVGGISTNVVGQLPRVRGQPAFGIAVAHAENDEVAVLSRTPRLILPQHLAPVLVIGIAEKNDQVGPFGGKDFAFASNLAAH